MVRLVSANGMMCLQFQGCVSIMEGSVHWLPQLDQTKDKVGAIQGILEEKIECWTRFPQLLGRRWKVLTSPHNIHVLCGNSDKFLYGDVKAWFPAMTKLIHRTWLLVNCNVEYVVEGKGRHPCYQVYKHDKEYIEEETAWVKYTWDEKYEKI